MPIHRTTRPPILARIILGIGLGLLVIVHLSGARAAAAPLSPAAPGASAAIPLASGGAGYSDPGFAGEFHQPDGAIHLRARTYDPAQGRFLQRDSFAGLTARPQSLNRFAYTEGNPVTRIDPSGHMIMPLPNLLTPSLPRLTPLSDQELDIIQGGLDLGGLIPGFGEALDGLNGAISLGRGDCTGAALSFGSMIPLVGMAATGGKFLQNMPDAVRPLIRRYNPATDADALADFIKRAQSAHGDRSMGDYFKPYLNSDALAAIQNSGDFDDALHVLMSADGQINGALIMRSSGDLSYVEALESLVPGGGTNLMGYGWDASQAAGLRGGMYLDAAPGSDGFYQRLGGLDDYLDDSGRFVWESRPQQCDICQNW